jgi:hypothetical protein
VGYKATAVAATAGNFCNRNENGMGVENYVK